MSIENSSTEFKDSPNWIVFVGRIPARDIIDEVNHVQEDEESSRITHTPSTSRGGIPSHSKSHGGEYA